MKFEQLKEIYTGRSDVLMLYVTAHGVARNGQAYIMPQSFDATRPDSGLISMRDLLRQALGG